MRRRLFAAVVLLSAVAMWTSPSDGEQPRSAPQQKKSGMKGMFDPNTNFERNAKGRDHFYVSELGERGASLQEYAQSKGITDGKITREVYLAYWEQMKNNWGGKGKKGGPGGTPGAPGAPNTAAIVPPKIDYDQMAEFEFARRDLNGKGYLTKDEVPGGLRDDFAKWDTDGDGLIQKEEFKAYYVSRLKERAEREAQRAATQGGNDDDWEKRPTVYRAGKLPPNLPKWFAELDKDGDGQVSLAEWRRAGKDIEEFQKYDRNDDGLLTPQEVLRQEALAKAGATGHESASVIQNIVNQAGPMRIEIGGQYPGKKGGPPGGPPREKGGKKRMGGG
jgi:Ca2+-binding EF-hand superfamily protein